MRSKFKKGQYMLCRYNGDNGDLIVGKVRSVRSGEVVLDNCLSDGKSIKEESVLEKRNVRVSKRVAEQVIDVFRSKGKDAARSFAIEIVRPAGKSSTKNKALSPLAEYVWVTSFTDAMLQLPANERGKVVGRVVQQLVEKAS